MTQLPETIEAGEELDVQIAPFGTWKCHDGIEGHDDKLQIVDDAACDQVIANMTGEILVDIDHRVREGNTEAAAWISRLFKDPEKGLMARFKFTAKGAELVSARAYRFVSPAWFTDEANRISKITSVSLTNRPNLPVQPMLNAEADETAFKSGGNAFKNAPRSSDGSLDGSGNPPLKTAENAVSQNTQERSPHMDELKTVLGLSAEATDAEIVDAVKALKEKLGELEKGKAEAEAAEFAKENADKGIDKEVLMNSYLAAPDVARAMVKGLKPLAKSGAKTPLCNAAVAREPDMGNETLAGLQACKTPQERCDYVMRHSAELAKTR